MADLLWQVIEHGKAELPNNIVLEVAPKDWLETAKWLYTHIDGAPKQTVDLGNAQNKPFQVEQNGNSSADNVADILRVLAEAGVLNATTGEIDAATDDAVHDPSADAEAGGLPAGAQS
jgi:hypothetical protein